jgi:hypothetical protein
MIAGLSGHAYRSGPLRVPVKPDTDFDSVRTVLIRSIEFPELRGRAQPEMAHQPLATRGSGKIVDFLSELTFVVLDVHA